MRVNDIRKGCKRSAKAYTSDNSCHTGCVLSIINFYFSVLGRSLHIQIAFYASYVAHLAAVGTPHSPPPSSP